MKAYLRIYAVLEKNVPERLYVDTYQAYEESNYKCDYNKLENFINKFRIDLKALKLEQLNSFKFELVTTKQDDPATHKTYKYLQIKVEKDIIKRYEGCDISPVELYQFDEKGRYVLDDDIYDPVNTCLLITEIDEETILFKGRVKSFFIFLNHLEEFMEENYKYNGDGGDIHIMKGYGTPGGELHLSHDSICHVMTIC